MTVAKKMERLSRRDAHGRDPLRDDEGSGREENGFCREVYGLAEKCMAAVEKHERGGSPPNDPTRTPCEGHLRPHIDRLRSRGATKKGPPLEYP